MITIGLTGGIAAGKSSVARCWMDLAPGESVLIDSDRLAHQTLDPDTPTWTEVVDVFGEGILRDDRSVDRRKLGQIVFGDEEKRTRLNGIIHPAVRRMWTDRIAACRADGVTRQVVVDIPLLYEVGAEQEFNCVVVAACSEPTQMQRLMGRGLNESQARARVMAQWPMSGKMERADFVIWNDGSEAVMRRQSDQVWKMIKETYQDAPPQDN